MVQVGHLNKKLSIVGRDCLVETMYNNCEDFQIQYMLPILTAVELTRSGDAVWVDARSVRASEKSRMTHLCTGCCNVRCEERVSS
jgi:hypothetical protein